jgi:hypothetical protein
MKPETATREDVKPPARRQVKRAAAGLLFVFFSLCGWVYMAHWGQPRYYQEQYGPAVMLALGRGYSNPDTDAAPALGAFLLLETDQLDTAALPERIPEQPYTPIQLLYVYPQLLFAGVWRIAGVSWSALNPVFGIFYGITVVLAWGIFRLGMGRAMALFSAFLFGLSPVVMNYLPWFRDFGKAPFMLAVLLLTGLIALRAATAKRLILLAVLAGVICGIGMGFRDDVMTALPVFLAAILFFPPIRGCWKLRAGAAAVLVAVFAVSALPVLVLSRGISSCAADHLYLGMLERCENRLGLGGAPYSFGGPYSDLYVEAVIRNYGRRELDLETPPVLYDPEYDAMGNAFVKELIRTFPADFAARASAATLRILDGLQTGRNTPAHMTHPAATAFYAVHAWIMGLLSTGSRYQAVLALLLISAFSLRKGLLLLFAGLYFLGLNGIQFNLRHHFHLSLVTIWVAGFLLHHGAVLLWRLRDEERRAALRGKLRGGISGNRIAIRNAGIVLALLACVPAGLWTLRFAQYYTAGRLIQTCAEAPLVPLDITETPLPGERLRLSAADFPPAADSEVPAAPLLVVDIAPGVRKLPLKLKYRSSVPGMDWPGNEFTWSQVWRLPESAHPARLYIPVYTAAWSHFLGIEIAAEDRRKILGFHAWKKERDLPPILTFMMLRPDWRSQQRYLALEDL